MSDKKSETVKEFEGECEQLLHLVVIEQSFLKHRKRIVAFIDQNSALCTDLINNEQFKSCLFILNRLYNLCVEILRGISADLDPNGETKQFFTRLRVKEKVSSTHAAINEPNIPSMIHLVQSFHTLPDITEIKSPDSFHYALVLEYFLQITNNLAFINLKRNKSDVTIDLLQKALECISLTQCCSYYVKYHLSTVIVNLVYLTEENHRDEVTQLLCNVALYLERLEKDIDENPQGKGIYEYLKEKAFAFILFIDMRDQVFGKKIYKNAKSFFIARMCVVMAYYGDLLNELGKKQESDIARQHTKALEQQLIKTEQGRLRDEETKLGSMQKTPKERISQKKEDDNDDAYSQASFKSANTGFTGNTAMETQAKITKESIIYQKYVEVNGIKFKILLIHLKELQSVQIIVYNKPRNMLNKLFVHFNEILEFAKKQDIPVDEEKNANKVLTKVAKLLYFKDNELLIRELQSFKNIEDLRASIQKKDIKQL